MVNAPFLASTTAPAYPPLCCDSVPAVPVNASANESSLAWRTIIARSTSVIALDEGPLVGAPPLGEPAVTDIAWAGFAVNSVATTMAAAAIAAILGLLRLFRISAPSRGMAIRRDDGRLGLSARSATAISAGYLRAAG